MKVLEMLAAGKLTIEQANQLIEVLEVGSAGRSSPAGYGSAQPAYEGATIAIEKCAGAERRPGFRGKEGLAYFTLDQIITLSEHEVDPEFIKRLREAGFGDLSIDQIIALSEHEVDPDFIRRLRREGLADLTFEQIIALSEH